MSIAEKLLTIAQNEQKVYDKGHADGQQAEYDRFWDSFQQNGNRTNYGFAFGGQGWNAKTFRPKYPIKPSGNGQGHMTFRVFNHGGNSVSFKDLNITLDLRGLTGNNEYMFYSAHISELGILDISNMSAFSYSLSYSKIETVEKLIVSENTAMTYTFNYAQELKNIIFDGVIGRNLEIHYSPLTVESMKSAILHLKNYSGTSDEGKYKIKFSSACWNGLEADSTSPTGTTWKEYVQNLGWSI